MFCDFVGSTALASRLDPEDVREILGVYHQCLAKTTVQYDGFVARYMGDGALVYFGYPQGYENDTERAVRSGLALIEAITTSGHPNRSKCASALPPGWSWLAIWPGLMTLKRKTLSARRRNSPHGCRPSLNPTPS